MLMAQSMNEKREIGFTYFPIVNIKSNSIAGLSPAILNNNKIDLVNPNICCILYITKKDTNEAEVKATRLNGV